MNLFLYLGLMQQPIESATRRQQTLAHMLEVQIHLQQ
jgi:hypothetical protein